MYIKGGMYDGKKMTNLYIIYFNSFPFQIFVLILKQQNNNNKPTMAKEN